MNPNPFAAKGSVQQAGGLTKATRQGQANDTANIAAALVRHPQLRVSYRVEQVSDVELAPRMTQADRWEWQVSQRPRRPVVQRYLDYRAAIEAAVRTGEAFPTTPVAPKPSASADKAALFQTRLEELKAKLTPDLTEALVLGYLRAHLCDDSLSSLEEVFRHTPAAVDALLMAWAEVEKHLKKAPAQ